MFEGIRKFYFDQICSFLGNYVCPSFICHMSSTQLKYFCLISLPNCSWIYLDSRLFFSSSTIPATPRRLRSAASALPFSALPPFSPRPTSAPFCPVLPRFVPLRRPASV